MDSIDGESQRDKAYRYLSSKFGLLETSLVGGG